MPGITFLPSVQHFLLSVIFILLFQPVVLAVESDRETGIQQCVDAGWSSATVYADGLARDVLWKQPSLLWSRGAIVILHGGGGSHYQFCSGGPLVQPQVEFTRLAIEQGFAVFLLDSTSDRVTDAAMRSCGKRFDFSVLDRANVDLPFIEKVLTQFIPARRAWWSNRKIYLTGLSTGGFMSIRAATHFDNLITAFAPVSAADPYGTETNCDPSLSPRTSATGILTDIETGKEIVEIDACKSLFYPNEKEWESSGIENKPAFRQFHHSGDGIVDISCMKKARRQLKRHGYFDDGAFVLDSSTRNAFNHLWLSEYNQPVLDFFMTH